MSETVISVETNRPRLSSVHHVNRTEVSLRERAAGSPLEHRTFTLESDPPASVRVVQAAEARPDRGWAARLLVIV